MTSNLHEDRISIIISCYTIGILIADDDSNLSDPVMCVELSDELPWKQLARLSRFSREVRQQNCHLRPPGMSINQSIKKSIIIINRYLDNNSQELWVDRAETRVVSTSTDFHPLKAFLLQQHQSILESLSF